MMRYVKVIDGVVMFAVDSETPLNPPWYQSDVAQIGWIYDDGLFYEPAPEVPVRILSFTDFILRFPPATPGRIRSSAETNSRIANFVAVFFVMTEINLDNELLIRELNYLLTIKDEKGWLLLPSEITTILS